MVFSDFSIKFFKSLLPDIISGRYDSCYFSKIKSETFDVEIYFSSPFLKYIEVNVILILLKSSYKFGWFPRNYL